MSGFIFVLIMDWVMRHINNRKRGLLWKLTSVLEDLDYADDVALFSSRFADLQEKTDRLVTTVIYHFIIDSFLTGPLEPTNDQLPTSVAS